MKTLKQVCKCIDCKCIDEPCVDFEHLKQSAREWIEHFKKERYRDYSNESLGAIDFIKHFFNLEDEE